MKEGGFTLVEEGYEHIHSKKARVNDGNHTSMAGISRAKAEEIAKRYRDTGKMNPLEDASDDENLEGPMKRRKVDNFIVGLAAGSLVLLILISHRFVKRL